MLLLCVDGGVGFGAGCGGGERGKCGILVLVLGLVRVIEGVIEIGAGY